MVAEELLPRQVLHLPAVHDFLCNHAETLAVTANLGKQGDIHKSVTCMWALSSLKANLQHHITYRYPVCKYGTLIFRPNTDLIPFLQKTMWKLRQLECTGKSSETNMKSQHLDDLNHMQNTWKHRTPAYARGSLWPGHAWYWQVHWWNSQVWNTICLLTRSISDSLPDQENEEILSPMCFTVLHWWLHTLLTDIV